MMLRIFMLVILIPKIGVNGYLVALAISLFFITILNFICTKHYINFQTSYFKSIILPAFFSFGLIYLGKKIYIQLTTYTMVSRMYNISCLFIIILLASLSYLALLLKLHTKKK
jgi:O-antigen/teichoic acid export membrane protein